MLEFLYIGVIHNPSAWMTNDLLWRRMPRASSSKGKKSRPCFPNTWTKETFPLSHDRLTRKSHKEKQTQVETSETFSHVIMVHKLCCSFLARMMGWGCSQLEESIELKRGSKWNVVRLTSARFSFTELSVVGGGGHLTQATRAACEPCCGFPLLCSGARWMTQPGSCYVSRGHAYICLLRLTDVLIWDLLRGGTPHAQNSLGKTHTGLMY